MSTSTWNQNKVVLTVLLVVFGIPFFSCCVCAPMLAVIAPSKSGADDQAGREAKTVEPVANKRNQTKPPGFAARVKPASRQQLTDIASGLEKDFVVHPSAAYMVKASSYKDAYYVVSPLTGPGIEDRLGAWLRYGDPQTHGMVLSANGMAAEFSAFPEGSKTKANAW